MDSRSLIYVITGVGTGVIKNMAVGYGTYSKLHSFQFVVHGFEALVDPVHTYKGFITFK